MEANEKTPGADVPVTEGAKAAESTAEAAAGNAAETARPAAAAEKKGAAGAVPSRIRAGQKGRGGEQAGSARWNRDADLRQLADRMDNERIRDYIVKRVLDQADYHAAVSGKSKKMYVRFMTASIILGGLIPVFSVVTGGTSPVKFLIALFGASVTGINAYLALQNYRETWVVSRKTREDLLRILYLYFHNAGEFRGLEDQTNKDVYLVNRCESILSAENTEWVSIVKSSGKKV